MTSIRIKHFPEMEIARKDLILEIGDDRGLLGHLYISKSSLDFLPPGKQHGTISIGWDKFVRLMEKVEKKRRRKLKKMRKKADA